MKSKLLRFLLPLIFWISVWHIVSVAIGNSFLFPGVGETLDALFKLCITAQFYKAVALSTLRVIVGLVLGCVIGVLTALICNKIAIINSIVSPIITVTRCTPVASFIVVLWVLLSGDALSVFIGFIMVMPIIWQNTLDAISAIDGSLFEVTKVYEFSRKKTFKLLIYPTIKKFLFPAIITSVGLAWKSEIAAEIIAYTRNSIGQGINDAKFNLDTSTVFAWSLVIVAFSILLESLTKFALRRIRDEY